MLSAGDASAHWELRPDGVLAENVSGHIRLGLDGVLADLEASATPARRSLYRLEASTPRTGATGFGLWPTPQAFDATDINRSPEALARRSPRAAARTCGKS